MKWFIGVVCVLVFLLAGCSQEYAAGLMSGLAVSLDNANKKAVRLNETALLLDESTDRALAKAKEINAKVEDNPLAVVGLVDPILQDKMTDFVYNIRSLAAKAEEFKDEKGKVDWERIIMSGLLGVLGGGTGVNIAKNRKKT